MSAQSEVHFMRLPISLPCPVPVLPGSPETMRDGDAIPLEERTEACAVNAWWMIGGQPTCDVHLRVAAELLGVDIESVFEEGGRPKDHDQPWEGRFRYDQKAAQTGGPWDEAEPEVVP